MRRVLTILKEIEENLRTTTDDAFRQVEGVPAEDINNWRPALGLEDINTFYALLTHLISSGEWWILATAAGGPSNRRRASEFVATGDIASLRTRADQWLDNVHDYFETLTGDDLSKKVSFIGSSSGQPGEATVAYCLVHSVEHAATHLGHLHIERQIWNAERDKQA
jgi:hypothetical protein